MPVATTPEEFGKQCVRPQLYTSHTRAPSDVVGNVGSGNLAFHNLAIYVAE